MKTKNIKNYIVIVLPTLMVLISTLSCEELVDESPISEIAPDNFFRNNNDAQAAIIGMYDAMQPAFRLNHYYWGEFRGDSYINGNDGANANNIELTTNDVTSGNAGVLRWDDFYVLVNRANLAIANIPQISGFDANLLGEAQAMRAYAYFQAIRVWGAAPLFTEPVLEASPDLQRPRTDATTILNEVVLPDMLAAEENMNLMTNPYRFSLSSIWAFQAEVYGFLGEDELAREALLKVVNSNEFSLVTSARDWQNLFLNDNIDPFDPNSSSSGPLKMQQGPELIMSIGFSLNEDPGTGNRNRAGIFNLFFAGIPSYTLSPALENKWRAKFPIDSLEWVTKYPDTDPVLTTTNADGEEEFVYGDYRYYLSREGGTNIELKGLGNARLAKYNKVNFNQSFDDSDMVLYRYANIILYLAELENRLGNDTRALELINEFRTARQLPLVDAVEFGATLEERELFILDERHLELIGEAQRWWDLRRTNRAMEILNPILDTLTGGAPLTEERLLFPIFDEHIIENPLLEQTPGY
ncbi:RagB/SusD family nutrient uptake outer membrane protein [Zobellia roscoffensis]|uniref:RagB/SusD family nutrient uptake outer membrane protein n=1 Tax=Zobellia roscoffensis TaxID=2779508 RepID=UPI00188CC054|nr:RagB/SusD family nutrient uptake outer membrane protein [Zobellia roscoffensis]